MRALQTEGELLKQFVYELARASEFYLGMALVTQNGLDMIYSSIEGCLARHGRGSLLFGVDLPTEPVAIESLSALQAANKGNFELRRFQAGRTFFHPKFSIFIRRNGVKTAIVGSSNLTAGGLSENYETNVLIDDRKVVRDLLQYFEEHFQGAHAKIVDRRWLDQYLRLWDKRKKVREWQRKLREDVRDIGGPPANIPKRIKGHVFAFTGRIQNWPREYKLYPFVKRQGGRVADKAGGMGSAECLVHAEILGGRRSTLKLVKAHQLKIPIITEEQFFKLARRK